MSNLVSILTLTPYGYSPRTFVCEEHFRQGDDPTVVVGYRVDDRDDEFSDYLAFNNDVKMVHCEYRHYEYGSGCVSEFNEEELEILAHIIDVDETLAEMFFDNARLVEEGEFDFENPNYDEDDWDESDVFDDDDEDDDDDDDLWDAFDDDDDDDYGYE